MCAVSFLFPSGSWGALLCMARPVCGQARATGDSYHCRIGSRAAAMGLWPLCSRIKINDHTHQQTQQWPRTAQQLQPDGGIIVDPTGGAGNVRDREVGYDRISDDPRTILAPRNICCICPKNLQLPPNLNTEATTSWKTSKGALSRVSAHESPIVATHLYSPCSKSLPTMGASILTAINLITLQIAL